MKTILYIMFILSVTLFSTTENGKLCGIVTYKDSYESSKRPDAGAEIYAINETDVISTQYDRITGVIENFQISKSGYSLSVNSTIDPDRIKKVQENFDNAAKYTGEYISEFKQLPSVVRAVTNGKGNYTLNLKPGKYYILIVSGSVKSNNISELRGNIDYKIVDVRSAGETSLDVNFVKHEMTWIKLITFRQQPGC
jgi:hypothetical protein